MNRDYDSQIYELDGAFLLLLTHLPSRARPELRVGARVALVGAHPLRAPSGDLGDLPAQIAEESAESACAPWRFVGFGLCHRGHISVIRHGPLPENSPVAEPAAPAAAPIAAPVPALSANSAAEVAEAEGLADRLNLAELASHLQGPPCCVVVVVVVVVVHASP